MLAARRCLGRLVGGRAPGPRSDPADVCRRSRDHRRCERSRGPRESCPRGTPTLTSRCWVPSARCARGRCRPLARRPPCPARPFCIRRVFALRQAHSQQTNMRHVDGSGGADRLSGEAPSRRQPLRTPWRLNPRHPAQIAQTDRTNRTSPLSARSSVPNGTSATRRARLNHGGSRASARNAVASRSARTSLRGSTGVASHDLRSYPLGIRPLDLPSILPEPCGTPIDDLEEVGVRVRMVLGLRSEV